MRKIGAGCDWITVGWTFEYLGGLHENTAPVTFQVSCGEGQQQEQQLATTLKQVTIRGLRAGVGYGVRVSAVAAGRLSPWVPSSELLRTAKC